jgi:outer membrane protein assembly factor BamD
MIKKVWALGLVSVLMFSACSIIPFIPKMSPTEHLARGLESYDQQKYKDAKKHLNKAVDAISDPTLLPKALFLYGESLYHLKDYTQASQQFSRLSLSFPMDSLAVIARSRTEDCYQGQFQEAIRKFKDEDYLKARDEFKIIILSSRLTAVVDSARFYYGDCFYYTKDYVTAIGEFERLIKFYPRSDLVDDAQYKVGLSYYMLSPKYSLDQEYTLKAIDAFQAFLEDYTTSELKPEVEKMLLICRTKLSRKAYKVGELYRKMGEFEPAVLSFQRVIDTYYDTEFAPLATFWKGECLRKLGRKTEALDEFKQFIDKYPRHDLVSKAASLYKKLSEEKSNS